VSPMRHCGHLWSVCLLLVLLTASVEAWQVSPAVGAPDLHTTTLSLDLRGDGAAPTGLTVDLVCMDDAVWRARVSLGEWPPEPVGLCAGDFRCIGPGKTGEALHFAYVKGITISGHGANDGDRPRVRVRWTGRDDLVLPWERDPAPVAVGGTTMWPGLHRNNAGHFGWRWEPNGLLINNVSFGCIERSWYYFKPGREPNESFQLNFGVPGARLAAATTVVTADDAEGKTGLQHLEKTAGERDATAEDDLEADWTAVRWRRSLEAPDGRQYYQELRYSVLAAGIQVETDSPAFSLSFRDADTTRGAAGVAYATRDGVTLARQPDGIAPASMGENWLLLMSNDGSPEVPVLVVFQHRPDSIEWADRQIALHRAGGIGTIAIGTPLGAFAQPADLLGRWQADLGSLPLAHIRQVRDLLIAYPWRCREHFAVEGDWVRIRDDVDFLPWSDDWAMHAEPYSPLPPLVSHSVSEGYLPSSCVHAPVDMGIPTKWGPYWCARGTSVEYRLPIPDDWDYAALATEPSDASAFLGTILADSLTDDAIKQLKPGELVPTVYPHFAAHDFSAGAWRAANFLTADQRRTLRRHTRQRIAQALLPQNYRLRRDPITGAAYLGCSFVWNQPDAANADGFADIDYWQGLVLYGLYTHAKYAADWAAMERHWPLIRSLASYFESTSSWALMGPGARESGEMYHGDMPTAGYAGLVGFHRLAQRLGTPYQRDLASYLLARNAVPMAAKLGFLPYALKCLHQEGAGSRLPCTGFGERWQASFPGMNPAERGYGYGDPWWRTGCIGPQGAQPEVLDLYMQRCRRDLLAFEESFMATCPDEALKAHDEIRVPPHIMARTYLSDEMPGAAIELARAWRRTAMLRDAHVYTGLMSWDVPVRMLDWAPAYLASGVWDAADTAAIIRLECGVPSTRVRFAVRAGGVTVTLNGRALTPEPDGERGAWRSYWLRLGRGAHELRIAPAG